MAFLILCPACLQRLELPDLDPLQVAATGGLLCTCVRCGAPLRRDDRGHVLPGDGRPFKLYAIPDAGSRGVVRRERPGGIFLRARGGFGWLIGKRVLVTDDHVKVRLWIRPKIRQDIPLAHARGVVIIQHIYFNPLGTMWGTYLLFDELSLALAAFSKLERAIELASAINIALLARKPARDPYRGLLAEGAVE